MSFSGARFKKCRERAGYSQERLREEINRRLDPQEQIGRSSIGAWENGRSKNPHALPLSVAAEVLGVSVDDFDDTPVERKLASIADSQQKTEADRLNKWGFAPGFFEFLESQLGCGIETNHVWYIKVTGEYWVSSPVEPFLDDLVSDHELPPTYFSHDAVHGVSVTNEEGVPRSPDDYYDVARLGAELGAIFHYPNRKKDHCISLTDLYGLQYRLGKIAQLMLQEMFDDPRGQRALPPCMREFEPDPLTQEDLVDRDAELESEDFMRAAMESYFKYREGSNDNTSGS